MYELIQAGEKSYYINYSAKIGISCLEANLKTY